MSARCNRCLSPGALKAGLGVLLLAWGIPAALWAKDEPLKRFEFRETHMGMPFVLTLYALSEDAATQAAKAAFARIHEIDERLSDYNADSELNSLNRTAGSKRAVPASDDLFRCLQASQRLSERTRGAFDASIGPLVKKWRLARRRKALPTRSELQAARELVDYRQILINEEKQTVELVRQGMQLDLGGIAAGYAVDEALKVLRAQGLSRAMIDASGDIGCGDPPPDSKGWRIGVAPLEPEGPPGTYLLLKNAAVTTSGDAFQFVEIGDVRYSHIVDPKTGLGLTRRSSVTVVARTCMAADSYATAISVLGPDAGLDLVRDTPGMAALIVEVAGRTVQTAESETFARWVDPQE